MDTSRRQFVLGSLGAAAALSVARAAGDQSRFTQFDPHARHQVSEMSLEQKIGQMTQPDQMYLASLDDIDKYHLGSLLSGGDSDPKSGNDLLSWTDLYDGYQSRALRTKQRIPLLYGIDAVHGHNNVIGAVIFPHNIGLGCSRNAALVEKAARITAIEVRATGINWAFAPCVTVPQDIRWGRTYEGFSESPDIVKVLGAAATRGLQGKSLDDPLSVLACAKHYVGDGGTSFGTGLPRGGPQRFGLDQGDTRMDEAALRKTHLPGYITAIAMGVGTIMPSYSSWNGVKCSASSRLLTGILKQELGFEGFLISDYNALDELPGTRKQQVAQAINAGMDMVMITEKYRDHYGTLKELVQEGTVPMSRIDDAAVRILRVKFAMGLMNPERSFLADRTLHKSFGSPEHRQVARQCVRESLVLLKNEKETLPVKKSGRIHVAGKCADDIGNQCGGWTITWQGKSGEPTKGTTILAGIRGAARGAQVSFSRNGSGAEGAGIGIAVIGETPYAEMQGDRTDLHLAAEDVAVVDRMKSAGIPVVAVIVSGRPLLIDSILEKADAIVAAWLPGSEGDGVADVLFGEYKPTGKLSFTWPRGDSTSLERSDPGYKTLFPFGYGIS
ncbi:MAG TPA: glycoside hydrolase family 3 N-terminal domain-containing protein [Bryobacteraceae bacterium]|jgi:beta-glucosidase|nr:glycoside hydrolase family 3 N-terminal domain-containing protein [Bryobacteraceae bacterium]